MLAQLHCDRGSEVCVPFMVTNYGYGIIWDNPSKTVIEPGFNERTSWTSEVGDRVSFFVIAGSTLNEIYAGYRLLTGTTPMLPKAAYGYIQCKQRYASQEEVLAVAKGYRERHLPADILCGGLVLFLEDGRDGFCSGQMAGPSGDESSASRRGFSDDDQRVAMLCQGSRYYDFLMKKGWFEHLALPPTSDRNTSTESTASKVLELSCPFYRETSRHQVAEKREE